MAKGFKCVRSFIDFYISKTYNIYILYILWTGVDYLDYFFGEMTTALSEFNNNQIII